MHPRHAGCWLHCNSASKYLCSRSYCNFLQQKNCRWLQAARCARPGDYCTVPALAVCVSGWPRLDGPDRSSGAVNWKASQRERETRALRRGPGTSAGGSGGTAAQCWGPNPIRLFRSLIACLPPSSRCTACLLCFHSSLSLGSFSLLHMVSSCN
jgi:hypothetical protein